MSESTAHYLLITAGTTGDMYPFMHLARSLQALGKRVTLIANADHEHLIRSAGLPYVALATGPNFLRFFMDPSAIDPETGRPAFGDFYRNMTLQVDEAVRSLGRQEDCVAVVQPCLLPGAAVSRERGRIRSIVAVHLAPAGLRSCHDPMTIGAIAVPAWVPMGWRRAALRYIEKRWQDPMVIPQINAVRAAAGLTPVASAQAHLDAIPDHSIALFPPWFAPPAPDWPSNLVIAGFPLEAATLSQPFGPELSAFLAGGDPPLVFTPGTGNERAADFFRTALAATQALGRRAIFLSRKREQVPVALPATVLWQPFVPLSALLPHSALLVHHGGIGTTAEALRAGIPQLITPFAFDQFDNGRRIGLLGAGRAIPARRLRPGALARALAHLSASDAVRARCGELAALVSPGACGSALATLVAKVERVAAAQQAGPTAGARFAPGVGFDEHGTIHRNASGNTVRLPEEL